MRFNWEYYIYINDDLLNNGINNEVNAYNHFKQYGLKEKRIYCDISILFNWINYKENNPDLIHISSEIEAWRHFLYHAKNEQRYINNKEYLIPYCLN
jgi:hypothetical protein